MKCTLIATCTGYLLLATAAACAQTIESITISPAQPNNGNPITVQIQGTFPNPCVPDPTVQTTISGNTIFITLNSNFLLFCADPVRIWNVSTNVGPLPSGNYTVSATVGINNLAGTPVTKSFSVGANPLPTPAPPSLILALTGLCASGYFGRRRMRPSLPDRDSQLF